jgi:potassium-dependent mechanosensitive channel
VAIRLSSSVVRDRFWSRVIAVVAWTIAALNILGVLEEAIASLESLSLTIGSFHISPITVVTGLLWLALLLWLASWAARILEMRVLSLSRLTPSVQLLFSRLIKVALTIAAVFIALGTIGIDLTALAVFTGALGVGIGFGLQAIFNNFVAGLILLSEKSLKVGDFVDLEGGLAGTVRQINIRNTIITTPLNGRCSSSEFRVRKRARHQLDDARPECTNSRSFRYRVWHGRRFGRKSRSGSRR